jgi:hypothetical protein
MIKEIKDEECEIVKGWWAERGFPVIPRPALPDDGFIAFVEGKPMMAGFLYFATSGASCWLAWVVGNPDSSFEERDEGFKILTEYVESLSKSKGLMWLTISNNNDNLIKKCETLGYTVADKGSALVYKIL